MIMMNNQVPKKDELEFNKNKREGYEQLMKDSSTQLDGYWDRKNPFVVLFLLILFVFIVVGAGYYIITYYNTMR